MILVLHSLSARLIFSSCHVHSLHELFEDLYFDGTQLKVQRYEHPRKLSVLVSSNPQSHISTLATGSVLAVFS